MTHNSWVAKEDIERNEPEALAMYQNTLVNAAKCALAKTMMTLVVE